MIAIPLLVAVVLICFIWTTYLVVDGDDIEQYLAVIPFIFMVVFAVFTHMAIMTTLMDMQI